MKSGQSNVHAIYRYKTPTVDNSTESVHKTASDMCRRLLQSFPVGVAFCVDGDDPCRFLGDADGLTGLIHGLTLLSA